MTRLASLVLVGAALALAAVPVSAGAQVTAQRQQSVRFLLASNGAPPVALDVGRTPVLRQRLTLDLQGVTVREALTAISDRARLVLWYTDDVIAADRRVNLRAHEITVAAALTEVLVDAGVDVVFNRDGTAVIVKRLASVALVQVGTISGRVTDSTSGEGVAGVAVTVEGSRPSTTTATDGRYTIRGVAVGTRTVNARKIGFSRQSRSVTVTDNETVTADFALLRAPTMLSEVVTTATGDQRRLELGHVIATINADSLVREAPVTSVSDLLMARVPGALVTQNDGQVGGNGQIRIRGPNTVRGFNDAPVVVVDGIRYAATRHRFSTFATPDAAEGFLQGVAQPPSRLNDLNINDIESIDVVKGSAASTLYGPDAANGVIVITTKRGRPGPARWRAYAKAGMTDIPVSSFPDNWWGWSRGPTGQQNRFSCTLPFVVQGFCVQDSVTNVGNALNDPQWTIFDSKPRWEWGANVSGGRQDLRYYFSADLEEATGPIRLPPAEEALVKQRLGLSELREEMREPNHFFKANLRANVLAVLGERGELQVNTGYTQSATRTLGITESNIAAYGGAFNDTPSDTSSTPYASFGTPSEQFAQTSTEFLKRWSASASGRWRATSWLLGRATVGLDLVNTTRKELVRRGEQTQFSGDPTGRVSDLRTQRLDYTVTVDATATTRRGRVGYRTTVGAQYNRGLTDAFIATASDLLPGGVSFAQATGSIFGGQQFVELASLGSYVEQTVGLNERLFLTGALRGDGASTFGQDYDVTLNPKVSASWLVSEEPFFPRLPGLDELRLRYAFGASTIQPFPVMAQESRFVESVFAEGQVRSSLGRSGLASPDLRPERAREHEFGLDASAWDRRVQLELSWYRRRTADGIHSVFLPRSLSPGASFWTNVGLVTNDGFEAQVTGRVLDTRPVSWDVTLHHSYYDNELVELGDASPFLIGGVAEGYPLGVVFNRPIVSFADANGNGILESAEVVMGDTVFVGRSIPPREQVLGTTVGLFDQRVRISALFDRRSGHVVRNSIKGTQCSSGHCPAAVDPGTRLEQQAEVVALSEGFSFLGSQLGTGFSYWEKGDITRFRELSVRVSLPSALLRLLRLGRLGEATVTLQGRNLGVLSTAFSGPDPESAPQTSNLPVFPVNAEGIPQGRTWTLRFELGF